MHTNSEKKWKNLINLKFENTTINGQLILPVTFHRQEIFYFKQLSENLLIFMMYKYLISNKEIDKQIINLFQGCFAVQLEQYKDEVVDVQNGNDVIGYIIKKMAIGVDFERLTNVQVSEILRQMPYELQIQVKNIYEMFFGNPLLYLFEKFIDMLQEMAREQKPLKKMVKKVQDMFNRLCEN